jgi:hypothetical protein
MWIDLVGVLFENSTGCLDGQRAGWLRIGGLGATGFWLVLFLTVFSLGRLVFGLGVS